MSLAVAIGRAMFGRVASAIKDRMAEALPRSVSAPCHPVAVLALPHRRQCLDRGFPGSRFGFPRFLVFPGDRELLGCWVFSDGR